MLRRVLRRRVRDHKRSHGGKSEPPPIVYDIAVKASGLSGRPAGSPTRIMEMYNLPGSEATATLSFREHHVRKSVLYDS